MNLPMTHAAFVITFANETLASYFSNVEDAATWVTSNIPGHRVAWVTDLKTKTNVLELEF